jgi:hypothetical protein
MIMMTSLRDCSILCLPLLQQNRLALRWRAPVRKRCDRSLADDTAVDVQPHPLPGLDDAEARTAGVFVLETVTDHVSVEQIRALEVETAPRAGAVACPVIEHVSLEMVGTGEGLATTRTRTGVLLRFHGQIARRP